MLVATAGHVDHGKTSLIKALTHVDTDRLLEEKQRGLTIDLGFAYHALGDAGTIGFIDVPGHEKFLANMLSGVAGIDLAMLIVAADDGPMPQTREHLSILQLLGIKNGIVVITKCDRVSDDRLQEVAAEVQALTDRSFLAGSSVFNVSSLQGEGIESLGEHLNSCAEQYSRRDHTDQWFRLAIDRSFSISGQGIIVTGTVFSGSITVDETLYLSNSQQQIPLRVRSIHADGTESSKAVAGQRCALNISGADLALSAIKRGDWVLQNNTSPSRQIDVQLRLLDSEKLALRHWSPVHFHSGSGHTTGRIALLPHNRSLQPGATSFARLVLDNPMYCIAGDRFIVRDRSAQRTVGGGKIIDTFGPEKGRSKPERMAVLENMQSSDRQVSMASLLDAAQYGIKAVPLFSLWNLKKPAADVLLQGADALELDDIVIHKRHWQSLADNILSCIENWNQQNLDRTGISPQDLLRELNLPITESFLLLAINHLLTESKLTRSGHLLHAPSHQITLSPEDLSLWEKIRVQLEDKAPCPPVIHDLSKILGVDVKTLRKDLRHLNQLGLVKKVTDSRFFSLKSLRHFAGLTLEIIDNDRDKTFTVAQFRDISGIGRRASIELLEYFDAMKITRRFGNERKVVNDPASIFEQ